VTRVGVVTSLTFRRRAGVEGWACRRGGVAVGEAGSKWEGAPSREINDETTFCALDIWHGVAMDSLKIHPGLPCPTLLCPEGGPPPKWPLCCFRGGSFTGRVACRRLLPFWTPHAVRLCSAPEVADAEDSRTKRETTALSSSSPASSLSPSSLWRQEIKWIW
jgi:hypothetical protein